MPNRDGLTKQRPCCLVTSRYSNTTMASTSNSVESIASLGTGMGVAPAMPRNVLGRHRELGHLVIDHEDGELGDLTGRVPSASSSSALPSQRTLSNDRTFSSALGQRPGQRLQGAALTSCSMVSFRAMNWPG